MKKQPKNNYYKTAMRFYSERDFSTKQERESMRSLVNLTEERKRNQNKIEVYRKQFPTYYVIPELYPQFYNSLIYWHDY